MGKNRATCDSINPRSRNFYHVDWVGISLGKGVSGQQDEEDRPPRFSFDVYILTFNAVATSSQSPNRRYTELPSQARAYSSGIIILCPDLQLVVCLLDGLCEKHENQTGDGGKLAGKEIIYGA